MNRIAIKLTEHGEIDQIASDEPCRIFVVDRNCKSEPVYQMTQAIGVHEVRKLVGDDLAATGDSVGPWLQTKPTIAAVQINDSPNPEHK